MRDLNAKLKEYNFWINKIENLLLCYNHNKQCYEVFIYLSKSFIRKKLTQIEIIK
jgi:hypothetical protein